MKGGALTVVSGVGAFIALVVLLVAVAIGPDDGGTAEANGAFAPGALIVGLQDDQLTAVSADLVGARIDRLAASRVRFTRVQVRWVEVAANKPSAADNPDDPAYAWGLYDTVLDGLRGRGIEAMVTVSGAPAWANGGKGPEVAPTASDFGAFMKALAKRYDGTAHAKVRMFEPWNEPNNPAFLMPQWDTSVNPPTAASPLIYADLLAAARTAVKAVSPDAEIVGLGTAHIEASLPPSGGVGVVDFIRGLVDRKPQMDAASIHLQPSVLPNVTTDVTPSFATLPRLVQEIDAVASGVPVYVTEVGYATGTGGLSEADQATAVTQAFQRLATIPRIRLAIWLGLQDSPARASGLTRSDGTEKPAWTVFATGPTVFPSAGP